MAKYTLIVASKEDSIYKQGFSLSSPTILAEPPQSNFEVIEVERSSDTTEVHVSYVEKKKID